MIHRQNPHAAGAQACLWSKAAALGYLVADQGLEIGESTGLHGKESSGKRRKILFPCLISFDRLRPSFSEFSS